MGKPIDMKIIKFSVELSQNDYYKLEKIISVEGFATKVDFIRSVIRQHEMRK